MDSPLYAQALARMQQLCARREQCSGDLRRKLEAWDLSPAQRRDILHRLETGGWFNNARYARAYVHDKAGLQGWGPLKIKLKLREKGLSTEEIRQALETREPAEEADRLLRLLQQKARSLKPGPEALQRQKLLRFAASRGYDYEAILHALEQLPRT